MLIGVIKKETFMSALRTISRIGLFLIIAIFAVNASAQWPNSADSNLVVADQTGSQTTPIVAATSNGGCYISWYNTASGNYDMYMQYFDISGIAHWDSNGLCVSNHTQNSYVTDYDLTVDNENNAILVVNDIRTGGDWDIYAYKIDSTGNFLWGANGLTISNNSVAEYIPQVAVTTNNNVVVVWQEEDTICVRKVNPAGLDLWTPSTKKYFAPFGMNFPCIIPSDNDAVILLYLRQLASGWWPPKNIYVNKLDSAGHGVWANDTVAVSNAGGLGPQMHPQINSDGAGGVYCYWYDSRDNSLHAYAQHIKSDGTAAWQADGVLLSNMSGRLQGPPSIAKVPYSPNVMFFFPESNTNQSMDGIVGQCLDSTGEFVWNPEGIELIPLGSPSISSVESWSQSDGAIIIYNQSPNDVTNCLINALKVDSDGQPLWPEWPIGMSTFLSPKGYLESDVNSRGQVIAAWEDDRNDTNGDLYLQNINPDGTLGEMGDGINDPAVHAPAGFTLMRNYPNPFNMSTIIDYTLPRQSDVSLCIYDILGKVVLKTELTGQAAGYHQIVWNAGELSSGIYFCKVYSEGFDNTVQMTLLK
jgi:hypothetical protein